MKILKPGKNPEVREWSAKLTCTGSGNGNAGCKAVLLVSQSDLFQTQSHARDETTVYITFMCPQCGALTDIYNSEGHPTNKIPGLLPAGSLPYAGPALTQSAQKHLRETGNYISPAEISDSDEHG